MDEEDTDHDHEDDDHEDDDHEDDDHEDDVISPKSKANSIENPWVYAVGASLIISISGFICAACIGPRFKTKEGKYRKSMKVFLNVLLAFAAGALVFDAILHMIPFAFFEIFEQQEELEGRRLL